MTWQIPNIKGQFIVVDKKKGYKLGGEGGQALQRAAQGSEGVPIREDIQEACWCHTRNMV